MKKGLEKFFFASQVPMFQPFSADARRGEAVSSYMYAVQGCFEG
jgi:hypothetical protein